VHEVLLQTTAGATTPQVFTLHAELEGMKWRPAFERLLQGWTRQGYALCSMEALFEGLDLAALPRHAVASGSVPGRSGSLAVQGAVVR
jgi:undecaprenyl phosphate-alpha-L-ara4FN deformylase